MNVIINKKVIVSVSMVCLCVLIVFEAIDGNVKNIKHVTPSVPSQIKQTETNVADQENQIAYNDERTTESISSKIIRSDLERITVKNKNKEKRNNIGSAPTISLREKNQIKREVADAVQSFTAGKELSKPQTAGQHLSAEYALPVDGMNIVNRDKFIAYEEQGRIRTNQQTTSTFSIDVDTGSYTFSRKTLALGQRPNKNAVRTEEFLNYFDYKYPKQADKPFSLYYEVAPAAFDKGRHLLMLGLNTKEATRERKPWNLTFLIDTSGSMHGADRLGLVKRSLTYLVENMKSEDKVSLVTYAGSSALTLDGTGIKEKQKIIAAIEALGSGGSTHGSAGIHLAYDTNKKHTIADGVNRVVLATDGDFNVGLQSHDALVNLIEEKRKSGISLSAIGVGHGNYNDAMLEQIANKGNGNYFYIDSFTEARNVFGKKLVGNMEIVAKDVKIQIEFNPEHVLEYRLIGYDNRTLKNEDFTNDKVDAGEIGAGHSVTALYEVVFKDSEFGQALAAESRYNGSRKAVLKKHSNELAFLKVRYKEPAESSSKLINFPLLLENKKESLATSSNRFRFASAVYYFASMLKESKYAPEVEVSEITKLAESAIDNEADRRELVEMMKNL